MSAKWAKLREIVGKVEEDEPEGEAVAGPSGEATIQSSGITPSLLSFLLLLIYMYTYAYIFFQHILVAHFTPEFLPCLFLADESTDEETHRPKSKGEEDVDTLYSWVQVGGSCSNRGGGVGASVGSKSYLLLFLWFLFGFLLLFYTPTPVLFHLLGVGSTEKGRCPTGGSPEIRNGGKHLEADGLEKMEVAVAGSKAEGFYGLLQGAMLHSSVSPVPPPHKKVHHTPSATISHLPLQGVHRT